MIRFATEADLPQIVELARLEHAGSQWKGEPFDEDVVRATASSFIRSMGQTAIVSAGEDGRLSGYLLGLVQQAGFSRALMALEYAWFDNGGRGLKLLGAFEAWAGNMDATYVLAHAPSGADDKMVRVLGKVGWAPVHSTLMKQLKD